MEAREWAVLLSCHYDIVDWLQPDRIYDMASGEFSGRGLRRRPAIELDIFETDWRYWPAFEPHHYLKLPKMIAAKCYVAFVGEHPVAHVAVSTRPGLVDACACRLVVMPEWQGAGIGLRFLNAVCERWRTGANLCGLRVATLFHTSHPGLTGIAPQISAMLLGNDKGPVGSEHQRLAAPMTGYGGGFRAVQGFRYYGRSGAASYLCQHSPAPPNHAPLHPECASGQPGNRSGSQRKWGTRR